MLKRMWQGHPGWTNFLQASEQLAMLSPAALTLYAGLRTFLLKGSYGNWQLLCSVLRFGKARHTYSKDKWSSPIEGIKSFLLLWRSYPRFLPCHHMGGPPPAVALQWLGPFPWLFPLFSLQPRILSIPYIYFLNIYFYFFIWLCWALVAAC